MKNEFKNKTRIILILITIAFSCTTIFICLNGINLVKLSKELDMKKSFVGKSQYIVYSQDNELFSENSIRVNGSVLGSINYYGVVKKNNKLKKCTLIGVNKNKFFDVFNAELEDKNAVDNKSRGVVISHTLAEYLSKNKNDYIKIKINSEFYKFKIEAIAQSKDFFSQNPFVIVIPKSSLNSILNVKASDINKAYIYDCSSKVASIKDISIGKKQYISNAIDENAINSDISMYAVILILIFIFVLFMSVYILFNIYRTYIIERSVYIGTLRTNGATCKNVKKLFIEVNVLIALAGSIIGLIIGMIVILFYSYINLSFNYIEHYGWLLVLSIIISLIYAISISFLCMNLLLKKALDNTERVLVTNKFGSCEAKVKPFQIIVFILLILIYAVTSIYSTNNIVIEGIVFIVLIILAVLGIKTIILILDYLFGKRVCTGTFFIAIKNIIHNSYVQKNITITAIISMLLILIGTLSLSVVNGLTSFYNDYKCESFIISDNGFTNSEIQKISNIKQIKDTYSYSSGDILFNKENVIACFVLKDPVYFDNNYMNLHLKWSKEFNKSDFQNGYYCIISDAQSRRYNLKINDSVKLKSKGVSKKYKIVAISGSLLELGDAIYISNYSLPYKDFATQNTILIKCKDTQNTIDKIETTLPNKAMDSTIINDKVQQDKNNSLNTFSIFYAFSTFIIIIGLQGIYSNYKISYLFRKKEFAVMVSLGYELKHIFKILLFEVLVCSILGSVIGLGYAYLLGNTISVIMRLLDLSVPLVYNIRIIFFPLTLCIGISLISLLISFKHVKELKANLIRVLRT